MGAVDLLDAQKLLADLTEPQRQAATHMDGPLLIVAGAGSGKTRVITRRVAYLMSRGIPGSSILAITFTNKAAGEMKSRVGQVLGRELRDFGRLDQPWPLICTFHSLGLRILRHYADKVGLAANFSVYDTADQERVVKEAVKAAELSTENFPPSMVLGQISNAKNRLQLAKDFAASAHDFAGRNIARIYAQYEKLLAKNHAVDFDDLPMRTVLGFRDHADMLAEVQGRFQYILIDEYQDTNHAQYMMAHLLALKHRNVCVVGDPDQSIYAWRGADIRNILDFEKDYPDAKVVRLEQNYRSTKAILAIASKLIARNRQRKDKALWTQNPDGVPAQLLICDSEHDEAAAVVQRLEELHRQGHDWSQMAVFYRVNALMRVMEDALRRARIPYRVARGVAFFQRKEIKDVLAYLRVIANPADEVSLQRIINTPARGISDATVKQLQVHAAASSAGLWDVMLRVGQIAGLQERARKAVAQFAEMVRRWQSLPRSPVRDLLEDVVRTSGYEKHLRKLGGQELDELGTVNELITSAAEYDQQNPEGSLEHYLAQVALVSDVDGLKDNGGAVTLMTLHAAKGLEFPVVAIIGLEEGLLPHSRVMEHPEQLEEERRLCFVGITRAQQRLILSQARSRMTRGQTLRTIASRFLAEMPAELLDVLCVGTQSHRQEVEEDLEEPALEFRRGQLVRHARFGVGRIMEISRSGQHTRAVIEFQRAGRKTLVLQYADLEPID